MPGKRVILSQETQTIIIGNINLPKKRICSIAGISVFVLNKFIRENNIIKHTGVNNKIEVTYEKQELIISNKDKNVPELSVITSLSAGVIRRVLKEHGINKSALKSELYLSKIPKTAIKKEFFNFDVYSSGHVINRNTGMPTIFKLQKRMRKVNNVEYPSVEKKSDLHINQNGVKKTVTISLAKLIGILFVPNPNRYQFIRYKSGGRFNCDANNLEWSDMPPQSGRVKIMKSKLDKHYQSLNTDDLHPSDICVCEYYKTKDIIHIYSFFKKESKFFKKIMIKEWITSLRCNNPNYQIIEDLLKQFVDEAPSLIDRGFFAPKINHSWFLMYSIKHLKGRVKDFIFRKSPKQCSLDELSMPKHLLMSSYSDRTQKHDFA